jgi:hypothetical protein
MVGIAKSSIGPTESRLWECSVCDELGSIVAEDRATGGVYCNGCIGYALNAEMLMRVAWTRMGVRHPSPNEFMDCEDH